MELRKPRLYLLREAYRSWGVQGSGLKGLAFLSGFVLLDKINRFRNYAPWTFGAQLGTSNT